ncbi:MAG: protein kinase [Deltaproteobacteria bacterium]|nr:protein kinase [Deltaproteobacteria bacterium]
MTGEWPIQRAHPRFGVRIPVWVWRPDEDLPEEAEAINVSAGGMLLDLPHPPPAGARVRIGLHLGKHAEVITAEAEVLRHQERDGELLAGVRFVEVSEELAALIDRLASDVHTFGDLQIEALVGKGGMAEVYRASKRSGERMWEKVAFKRIRPELLTSATAVRLFHAEGLLASKLKHPNIVEVYEVGERMGLAYIVMELVEGCDLERLLFGCRLRKIQLPVDLAVYVAHTVAVALHHAHTTTDPETGRPLGIVHRDVGPSNVFISELGEIKVGDFGVAHFGDLATEITGPVGKPSYQAPEQIEGARPHPAMDVFATGCVLFELLTGERAFPLSADQDGRPAQLGPPPSARALRAEVPEALEAVLVRALAHDVDGQQGLLARLSGRPTRHASCGELAAALEACFDPAIGNQLAIAAVVRGVLASAG